MKFISFIITTSLITFTLFNNHSLPQNQNSLYLNNDTERQNNEYMSVSIKGGVVIQSLDNWIDNLDTSDPYYNHKQGFPGFISSLSFSYPIGEKQFLELALSVISADITANNSSLTATLNFKTYTISVNYKYFMNIYFSGFRPYIGAGINYLSSHRIDYEYRSTENKIENSSLYSSGYGVDLFTGLVYDLNKRIVLSSELKIIYQDANASKTRFLLDAKSFGIHLLFGIGYKL